MAGQLNPHSLCLPGTIHNQNFQVLIDNGSTHNFIKPALAEHLGLSLKYAHSFRVYIGNDDSLVCQFCCSQVPLTLQGHLFLVDLFILPIEGPDVVLGIQWLQQLGRVSHDYVVLTMDFCWHGNQIQLQGNILPNSKQITLLQFQVLLHQDAVHSLFEIHTLPRSITSSPITPKLYSDVPFQTYLSAHVLEVLYQFENLFRPLSTLPPHHVIDHRIHLLLNTKPVNVRPYHYLYFQKTEMERLVQETLEQDIIRPSQSPFSSPILLVKKKKMALIVFVLTIGL